MGRGFRLFFLCFVQISFVRSFVRSVRICLLLSHHFRLSPSSLFFTLTLQHTHISHSFSHSWQKKTRFRIFSEFEVREKRRACSRYVAKWDSVELYGGKEGDMRYRRHLCKNKIGYKLDFIHFYSSPSFPLSRLKSSCKLKAPSNISTSFSKSSDESGVDIRSYILRKLSYSYHYSHSWELQSYYPWRLPLRVKCLSQIDRFEVEVVREFCNRRKSTRDFQIESHLA